MATSFEHDMGEMVRESKASESKRSLAMNYVRATGKISNGEKQNVSAISDAIIAQTPIMLELYLESRPTVEVISSMLDDQVRICPVRLRKDEVNLTATDAGMTEGVNWTRMLFQVVTKIGWPGAFVLIVYILRQPLTSFLLGA